MQKRDLVKDAFSATMRHLLEDRPLEKITVEDIVTASGFSKRTFYNHFRDKYDLTAYAWRQIYERCWEDNGHRVSYLENLKRYHDEELHLANFFKHTLVTPTQQNSLWETIREVTIQEILNTIRANGFEKEADDDLVIEAVRFYTHGVHGLAADFLSALYVRHDMSDAEQLTVEEELRLMPEILKPLLMPECQR